jgi:hypothetical protein
MNIDKNQTVKTEDMPDNVKGGDLPPGIIDLINYQPPVISKP